MCSVQLAVDNEVDDFTKGALVTKEDLAKVELYGCTVALREVRAKCLKMNECILNIHMSLQLVLEDMCAVIHRKHQSNDDGHTVYEAMRVDGMEYDPSTLRPEAERAVMEMGKWSGEGSLPQILNMGTLFVSAGTGKIDVSGDEVVGFGTAFRAEVQVGDVIIVEPLVAQKKWRLCIEENLRDGGHCCPVANAAQSGNVCDRFLARSHGVRRC